MFVRQHFRREGSYCFHCRGNFFLHRRLRQGFECNIHRVRLYNVSDVPGLGVRTEPRIKLRKHDQEEKKGHSHQHRALHRLSITFSQLISAVKFVTVFENDVVK
ncbi:hypothetical protein D3C86_1790310 [compost metagenome]